MNRESVEIRQGGTDKVEGRRMEECGGREDRRGRESEREIGRRARQKGLLARKRKPRALGTKLA